MTYCVGLKLDKGILFMSDTRTNAGVDNISVFRKMITWEKPGERVITVMTAGNLATTQAVISLLDEHGKTPEDRAASVLEEPSMFRIARLVGETLRSVIRKQAGKDQLLSTFNATMIVGGQVVGAEPRLFLIYPEGNFIEASQDTPFFQIGETKYGRPILVRAYDRGMSFEEAAKLLLVSFDSTIKANLGVDLPIDYVAYEKDSFKIGKQGRIDSDDPYFAEVSVKWGEALRLAFSSLPDFKFKS